MTNPLTESQEERVRWQQDTAKYGPCNEAARQAKLVDSDRVQTMEVGPRGWNIYISVQ